MELNKIHNENCLKTLGRMPDEFVTCVVTSPPYYGLRDYGVDGQIGMEKTVSDYIESLLRVFGEIRRVLKSNGTVWLNLGDTYSNHKDCKSVGQSLAKHTSRESAHVIDKGKSHTRDTKLLKSQGFKNKDLMLIPHRVAIALQDSGWYVRQDIVWHKPNPMPESVTDRCTKAHEYIFLLTKSEKYYYDQDSIREPLKDSSIARLAQDIEAQKGSERVPGKTNGNMKAVKFGGNNRCPDTRLQSGKEWTPKMGGGGNSYKGHSGYFTAGGDLIGNATANKKSVWTIPTKAFKEAHFATFPTEIPRLCISAGSSPGDIIYDPFGGAGTTALVAHQLGRNWILSELNSEYCTIANKRLEPYLAQNSLF